MPKTGLTRKAAVTYTEDDKNLELPFPISAPVIDFNLPKFSDSKDEEVEGTMHYRDSEGNTATQQVTLKLQGSSSIMFLYKNQTISLPKKHQIRFGSWIADRKFHLKNYYIDAFRGQSCVGYKIVEENNLQGPWMLWNDYANSKVPGKDFLIGDEYKAGDYVYAESTLSPTQQFTLQATEDLTATADHFPFGGEPYQRHPLFGGFYNTTERVEAWLTRHFERLDKEMDYQPSPEPLSLPPLYREHKPSFTKGIYDLTGCRRSTTGKGVNIVRTGDGTIRKVFTKNIKHGQ